jgi:hypothetical protein
MCLHCYYLISTVFINYETLEFYAGEMDTIIFILPMNELNAKIFNDLNFAVSVSSTDILWSQQPHSFIAASGTTLHTRLHF